MPMLSQDQEAFIFGSYVYWDDFQVTDERFGQNFGGLFFTARLLGDTVGHPILENKSSRKSKITVAAIKSNYFLATWTTYNNYSASSSLRISVPVKEKI
ncbi:hypothetical protein H5410_064937 [Solanum commersonii]|uniref:Uncharacterized protein n=1 Tax=Solanum commersonii TaxID=4109 RepID=A0A9J5VXY0_SOLCO|nr:hypothetical protein H5410_064937 [Solanum commersonii]